jgi:hypothetical protein
MGMYQNILPDDVEYMVVVSDAAAVIIDLMNTLLNPINLLPHCTAASNANHLGTNIYLGDMIFSVIFCKRGCYQGGT